MMKIGGFSHDGKPSDKSENNTKMGEWNEITDLSPKALLETRNNLHQAVQLVGAVPRNLLLHDPTDATASLPWNAATDCLESLPIEHDGKGIKVGLAFSDFKLKVFVEDQEWQSLALANQSVNEGLNWLTTTLEQLGLDSTKINLSLPYEIPSFDLDQPLEVDHSSLQVFNALYSNVHLILEREVSHWKDAFDIRCWPHHFDIATLIPLEKDKNGEVTKSIGVGLSPGDEGVEEPYIYVNVWPSVAYETLAKHALPAGHWNKHGWSGGVLTYSDFVAGKQEELVAHFVRETVQTLKRETS
ncbi:MAG: DUF5996 family protein [Ekhidna sp.]